MDRLDGRDVVTSPASADTGAKLRVRPERWPAAIRSTPRPTRFELRHPGPEVTPDDEEFI
ncbi:MAG: hypothetical protein IPH64_20645 [Comamonadaceae bacterium]|nr:hypothetical protein [Comamonadaceae bacterium]